MPAAAESEPHHAPAVLFDVDGTLVDSNYLHVHAWVRAFSEECLPVETSKSQKAESDVEGDPHVAGSRDDTEDDSYVGRTASEDDFDSGETGAEARSQDR